MLFGTTNYVNDHLTIGGVPVPYLAEKYGTPLFIYDVALMRQQMRAFKEVFTKRKLAHRVIYASKAFCSTAMYQLLQQEQLGCDVVSGGELYAALAAGMDPAMMEFHGNNKSKAELTAAVTAGIGKIVVDNFHEIELLNQVLAEQQTTQEVLFRIAPGVTAETHDYILTGQQDSKFGFDVASGQAEEALVQLLHSPRIKIQGIHFHIGSQIFAATGYEKALERTFNLLTKWRSKFGFTARIVNIGGGFGVRYTENDNPNTPVQLMTQITDTFVQHVQEQHYPLPEIWIEPGRSIVAEAGTTVYQVGSSKHIPGIRQYISVDGGMGDNIRPALYDATYNFVPVELTNEHNLAPQTIRITGKYCESGDILQKSITLPHLAPGDLIAMQSTGAYGYSMASSYNNNPRPAVVFVEDGQDHLVIRRETYADLTRLNIPLPNETQSQGKVGVTDNVRI
ncbi:diaminopimelate decarboxylase [Amylolactobacillus amylotrophicus DSM 20534]|uniref:Diaminopimelate decarboxylase n=3 Tax=Amylolactobacillus TaxID=2767876 RepID=A0A0R1YLZ8_9LACO|nr:MULTISPECIES: diaminopimelate decarboxylase [Amylolactobacillus]APT18436.1 diaminopimelate decarboxylase [Amylolactobacillus amylophilus DSM 20533 = JCM 1125]KRK38223.1 diaminopimelate decarboxylase [Amylolactobacillus amylotrophicus DSM 20534]KRM43135.1 diaminopimelate decarboxylase [Amylolactobacillus amylophilus DSM 20533 = JCM 1125]GED80465.1 diaminopimelate decarboxylase [Amylolactobacillus amylophilus]